MADYCQDAVLLVEMDGKLLVDANDAADRGIGGFLREQVARADESFLFSLTGYGDADMIHFFDEAGDRIPPTAEAKKDPGTDVSMILDFYGIDAYVPFSTMHRYLRADSAWANRYTTDLDDFAKGFESERARILPAYVRYDLKTGEYAQVDFTRAADVTRPPEDFGDDWSDELEPRDVEQLAAYFRRFEHLSTFLGWLTFRVGGKEHTIDVAREHFARGITFETPRHSLVEAVKWDVFDDLLIGNFTKTTLHGDWHAKGEQGLYPDFTPFVTKYGDNGGSRTRAELGAYARAYRDRGFTGLGEGPGVQASWKALAAYLDE